MNTLYHKYFLINHIGLISDICTYIHKISAWCVAYFTLPELNVTAREFYHTKNYIKYVKYPALASIPHQYENLTTFIDNTTNIKHIHFYYTNDPLHFYVVHIPSWHLYHIDLHYYQKDCGQKTRYHGFVDPLFKIWC